MNPFKLFNTETGELSTKAVAGHPVVRRTGDPATFNEGVPAPWVYIEDFPQMDNPTPDTHRVVRAAPNSEGHGWELIPLTEGELAVRNVTQPITKLTLMRRLAALGKWSTFKSVLPQMPEEVQDAWVLASDIRADDPLFVANRSLLLTLFEMTEAELDALLAPDPE